MTGWCSGLSSTGTASPCCRRCPKRRTCGPCCEAARTIGGRARPASPRFRRQPCPGSVRRGVSKAGHRQRRSVQPYRLPSGKSATHWNGGIFRFTSPVMKAKSPSIGTLKKNAGKKNILQEGFPPPRPHLSQYVQPMGRGTRKLSRRKHEIKRHHPITPKRPLEAENGYKAGRNAFSRKPLPDLGLQS